MIRLVVGRPDRAAYQVAVKCPGPRKSDADSFPLGECGWSGLTINAAKCSDSPPVGSQDCCSAGKFAVGGIVDNKYFRVIFERIIASWPSSFPPGGGRPDRAAYQVAVKCSDLHRALSCHLSAMSLGINRFWLLVPIKKAANPGANYSIVSNEIATRRSWPSSLSRLSDVSWNQSLLVTCADKKGRESWSKLQHLSATSSRDLTIPCGSSTNFSAAPLSKAL